MRIYLGTRRVWNVWVVALLVGMLASASALVALGNSPGETYYACLNPGGQLSFVTLGSAPECTGSGTVISWNQVGPEGPEGPEGPARVSGYMVYTTAFSSGFSVVLVGRGSTVTHTTTCPGGRKVLGGGPVLNADWTILASEPVADGSGWTARAHYEGSVFTFFNVRAICAFVD